MEELNDLLGNLDRGPLLRLIQPRFTLADTVGFNDTWNAMWTPSMF